MQNVKAHAANLIAGLLACAGAFKEALHSAAADRCRAPCGLRYGRCNELLRGLPGKALRCRFCRCRLGCTGASHPRRRDRRCAHRDQRYHALHNGVSNGNRIGPCAAGLEAVFGVLKELLGAGALHARTHAFFKALAGRAGDILHAFADAKHLVGCPSGALCHAGSRSADRSQEVANRDVAVLGLVTAPHVAGNVGAWDIVRVVAAERLRARCAIELCFVVVAKLLAHPLHAALGLAVGAARQAGPRWAELLDCGPEVPGLHILERPIAANQFQRDAVLRFGREVCNTELSSHVTVGGAGDLVAPGGRAWPFCGAKPDLVRVRAEVGESASADDGIVIGAFGLGDQVQELSDVAGRIAVRLCAGVDSEAAQQEFVVFGELCHVWGSLPQPAADRDFDQVYFFWRELLQSLWIAFHEVFDHVCVALVEDAPLAQ